MTDNPNFQNVYVPADVLQCIEDFKELNAIMAVWKEAMGFDPGEVNIFKKAWEMFEANLRQVSEKHRDVFKWLDWYIWENDAGAKKLRVQPSFWMAEQEIDSPAKLWILMCLDGEAAKEEKP
jgi:hypothetical protein